MGAATKMGRRTTSLCICICLGLVLVPAPAVPAGEQTLVIDFMVSSGAERSAWYSIIQAFQKQNPDIHVTRNEYDPEAYKRDLVHRIDSQGVDIAFWFAGERLRDMALHDRLAPLDPAFVDSSLQGHFAPATLEATRINGRLYGMPIAYYPWGLFYRRSLFRRLGLSPPATWSDFLHACDRLKAAGITPIALAAGDGWPAAGWFDLLDLRMNGLDFHRRLLAGEIPFRDSAARAVLAQWKALLDDHDFLDEALYRPWTDAMPYLYREKVGMVLMGSFIGARLPPDMAGDIGFFPFPRMSATIADYEDAPLDVLMLPRTSRHHDIALRFLAFLAGGNVLDRLNEVAHTFSPRLGAPQPADEVSRDEKRLLDGAAGLAFFFDRDASESIMRTALDSFKGFLAPPHDVDRTIGTLPPRPPDALPH